MKGKLDNAYTHVRKNVGSVKQVVLKLPQMVKLTED